MDDFVINVAENISEAFEFVNVDEWARDLIESILNSKSDSSNEH